MVSVQAKCGYAQALLLMINRAESSGESVEEIAQAVIERRIRFA